MTKDSETDPAPATYDCVRPRTEDPTTALQLYSSLHGQQRHRSSSGTEVDQLNRAFPTGLHRKTNDSSMATVNPYGTKTIEEYELKGIIGYGSSAVVYGALDHLQNIHVAIKMIDLDMFERNQIDELRRETALMALSKHENILPVYTSFVTGSKLCIVTPYLGGGSCLDIMKTAFPDGLDEISIATILKQALEGICYLHKNGHIHRDIKAGNLLVDDDGSVLLGDFGVSSSLMDTGERGLRKTFVGTPCWMAPEVMEQAGYDYKADIWSFGVTAIELANGQAPFAKLPPLKVLLMTLSNDPPTLVRETSKHKYSKVFKEMVDFCLCKDPANRPTAERLLQHPFFKQARKKDYLVKSILADLPPLERRPRKGIHRRKLSFTASDEWDFNDNNGDYINVASMKKNEGLYSEDIVRSAEHNNKNNNNACINNGKNVDTDGTSLSITDQPDNAPPRNDDLPKPRRHISFGHVVVRNPSQPSASLSTSQPSYSPISDEDPSLSQEPSSSFINSSTANKVKKPTSNPNYYSSADVTRYPIYGGNEECRTRKLRGISEPTYMSQSSNDGTFPVFHLTKSDSSDSAGERRSRFEIHHGHEPIIASSSSFSNGLHPPSTTSITASSHNNSLLSCNSVSTSVTNDISPASSVTSSKFYSFDQSLPGSDKDPTTTCEPRKVGRFELTSTATSNDTALSDTSSGVRTSLDNHQLSATSLPSPTNSLPLSNSNPITISSNCYQQNQSHHHLQQVDAPYSSFSITPPSSSSLLDVSKPSTAAMPIHLQSHVKELLKNSEAQRRLIEDIIGAIHLQRPLTHHHRPTSTLSSSTDDEELASIIESLEKQLCRIGNENSVLRMENRQLRKELELERMI